MPIAHVYRAYNIIVIFVNADLRHTAELHLVTIATAPTNSMYMSNIIL